jgi:glycosyltransferase involved in cell wall biosynthesis
VRKPYEIVVPLFNDEDNLVNLLDSLIGVGISPSDVLVSMSGPRGHVDELVGKYGFRLIYSARKLTPSVARNLGARQSHGDYIVFLDSDILVTPQWKQALDDITHDHKTRLVGETYEISQSPHWIEKNWFSYIRKRERTYLNGGNIIVAAEMFESLDGFDEALETGEDLDLCTRARKKGVIPEFNEQLVVHHEGNPKSIIQFIKREKWHAKGDLGSVSAFFESPVMLAAALYGLILVFAVLVVVFGAFEWALGSILLLLTLPFLLTVYKLKGTGANLFKSSIIMHFYLLGRGFALAESFLPNGQRR